jgi:hypothetical protein
VLERVNDFEHSEHLNDFSPVWVLMWIRKLFDFLNDWEHKEHLNSFSPVWILRWDCKVLECANDLKHSEHLNVFTPMWVFMWVCKSTDFINDWEHKEHMQSFLPVSILMWDCKAFDCENDWEHLEHLNRFSREWVCKLPVLDTANVWEQSEQPYGFPPVRVLMCFIKIREEVNDLEHSVQMYFFLPCDLIHRNFWKILVCHLIYMSPVHFLCEFVDVASDISFFEMICHKDCRKMLFCCLQAYLWGLLYTFKK